MLTQKQEVPLTGSFNKNSIVDLVNVKEATTVQMVLERLEMLEGNLRKEDQRILDLWV